MDKFQILKRRIENIIKESPIKEDSKHSILTYEEVMELCPNASEELKISALAHDIERAVSPRIEQSPSELYEDYKEKHAERSAEITANLMEDVGYDQDSINKVRDYITHHEVGGSEETDILMDADSITYFRYNVNLYYERTRFEKTKEKIIFMYERSSESAKKVISKLKFNENIQKVFDAAMEEIEAKNNCI